MITQIETKKLLVISDLHLGNPFSSIKAKTVRFIDWAAKEGFDICLNGDGFEIAQVSFQRLALDVPEVLQALKRAMQKGVRVFYVVGNHDIAFEHFLNDWGGFKLAPFLNIKCEGGRYRVEHGHLYDPFFVRSPRLYEFCTWLGGLALKIHPSIYRLWICFEKTKSQLRAKKNAIPGEPPSFPIAAREILRRGFDVVIFGHTHHRGRMRFDEGVYLNPGSWMISSTYVKIEFGKAELCEFEGHRG